MGPYHRNGNCQSDTIRKDGDKADMGNYRPISVIPVVVSKQLQVYLREKGLISDLPSGFCQLGSID